MYCHNCGDQIIEGAKFCAKCGTKSLGADVGKHTSTNYASSSPKVVSKKHKKLGIIFITFPFAVLVVVLLAWAIVIFFVNSSGADAEIESTTVNVIQWFLGFVGLLATIGIFVLVPLGIIFLNMKTIQRNASYDERSGQGEESIVPPEIEGWSWGAAGLTWIWGISNNVWLSLLNFVPLLNMVWWIVLGIKGNEWAWKAKQWESVEEFKESQRKWGAWGLGFFVFYITISIFWLIINLKMMRDF